MEQLTNGTSVEINESGTRLRYRPGALTGGKVEHQCSPERSLAYYIEGILPLLPFAKKQTRLILRGVTNDGTDASIDTIRATAVPLMQRFGVGEELELRLMARGMPPLGGGAVMISCPVVRELSAVQMLEPGFVKRVRGVACASRVSPQFATRMITSTWACAWIWAWPWA